MQPFLEPTQESGRAFFLRGRSGGVVMLNLLRFRKPADYSATPDLTPAEPMSGEAAYQLYMKHTLAYLEASGGKLLFYGRGGQFKIGPADERWDTMMLMQQQSTAAFMAFASNREHRQARVIARLHWLIRSCCRSNR